MMNMTKTFIRPTSMKTGAGLEANERLSYM